ncbi:F-box domain-containing protein [Tothia fuscella]|uniref:F-box domain-containing protein n=1 Tax=Tothia fuscella TaxID=1048955 RepID=A0A9P4TYH6_9PEZI|nr:F-box domain-containing protein [Tothia fuscella]
MASNNFSKENLISHLSHRPRYILRGHISIGDDVKLPISKVQREPQSSLGLLDDLSLELLHAILNYLDLQSLSRVVRVSLGGKAIVESLPAYRDIACAAGYIFQTLSDTRLISVHSAATLQAALHSDRCISCGQYGAFLFLLSAERCCFACFSYNPSLWLISLAFARNCFNLTRQQIKDLPTLRSIPGKYYVRRNISRLRPIKLTSVKATKELAIKVHGGVDVMSISQATESLTATNRRPPNAIWYHNAPLKPYSQDILTVKGIGDAPTDEFGGMGSIAFPSMSGSVIENGLWCRGCERTFELFRGQQIDRDVVSRLVPPGCDAFQFLNSLQYRARSEADFLEHAQHCYSASEVITKQWVGLF